MSDIRAIKTKADHAWAIDELAIYFLDEPRLGTSDAMRFEILLSLVSKYEDDHHPIPAADPVDVLKFAITDMGRSQSDLAQVLGSRSRASEILARKKALTLGQIRSISEAWCIPIAALTSAYDLTV